MSEVKKAWGEVADRLSALGSKLKQHTEDEKPADDDKEFSSGLEKLKSSINEVLDSMGEAARDPAVREDARSVASAFAEALDATIDDARKALKSRSAKTED